MYGAYENVARLGISVAQCRVNNQGIIEESISHLPLPVLRARRLFGVAKPLRSRGKEKNCQGITRVRHEGLQRATIATIRTWVGFMFYPHEKRC